jgi:hypothetical protein
MVYKPMTCLSNFPRITIVPCLCQRPTTFHWISMPQLFSVQSRLPTTQIVSGTWATIWFEHYLTFKLDVQLHSLYEIILNGNIIFKLIDGRLLDVIAVRSNYHPGQGGMTLVSLHHSRLNLDNQIGWIWTFVKMHLNFPPMPWSCLEGSDGDFQKLHLW